MYYASNAVNHPAELQADFQQTYGIMDIIGKVEDGRVSPIYAADLAAQLPYGSRIHVCDNPDAAWSLEAILLSNVVYMQQCQIYAQGGGKGKKPEPIFKPKNARGKGKKQNKAMSPYDLVKLIQDERMAKTEKPAQGR